MTPKYAIVRSVANTYDQCVRPVRPTEPINVRLAQKQHRAYCRTLKDLDLKLIKIEANERFPDCCFVEDPAIIIGDTAIISRMGVKSRMGEERAAEDILKKYKKLYRIKPPGTIEGGDVMRIGRKVYIGLSERTNMSAIKQAKAIARIYGYDVIPVRVDGMIHLKTGCTYLGNNCVTLVKGQLDEKPFAGYRKIIIPEDESYSANCLSVNGTVLMPKGYPKTRQMIQDVGFRIKELDMSEFRKGGGSLTCLSIIY